MAKRSRADKLELGGTRAGPIFAEQIVDRIHASSLDVPRLDDISGRTGFQWVDLLGAGNPAGAFSLIGGQDGGIQMYSEPNKMVFMASPTNGGIMRIGALDKPGITMTNGVVHIEGDCIVDGTLKASKLQLGELGSSILTEDRIKIGIGSDEVFSGMILEKDFLRFYSNGAVTMQLDAATGSLCGPFWPWSGVSVNGLNLFIASTYGYEFRQSAIIFQSYYVEGEGGIHVPMDKVNLMSIGSDIVFMGEETMPAIELRSTTVSDGAKLGVDSLKLAYGHILLREISDRYELNAAGGKPVYITNGNQGLVLDGNDTWVYGGGFVLPYTTGGPTYKGKIYFDTGTNKVRVWDGAQWRNLAYES